MTAFQELQFRAFDVQRVDYLTKRFSMSVWAKLCDGAREIDVERNRPYSRATDRFTQLSSLADGTAKSYAVRFLVKDGNGELLLPVAEIDWIEADAYYSRLHVNGKQYMLRETISTLQTSLTRTVLFASIALLS